MSDTRFVSGVGYVQPHQIDECQFCTAHYHQSEMEQHFAKDHYISKPVVSLLAYREKLIEAARKHGSGHSQSANRPMQCDECYQTYPCKRRLESDLFLKLIKVVEV